MNASVPMVALSKPQGGSALKVCSDSNTNLKMFFLDTHIFHPVKEKRKKLETHFTPYQTFVVDHTLNSRWRQRDHNRERYHEGSQSLPAASLRQGEKLNHARSAKTKLSGHVTFCSNKSLPCNCIMQDVEIS